ncbi:hypothetical protein KAR48_16505 [bacterium]|nr:hypothetical protein [bacterium]
MRLNTTTSDSNRDLTRIAGYIILIVMISLFFLRCSGNNDDTGIPQGKPINAEGNLLLYYDLLSSRSPGNTPVPDSLLQLLTKTAPAAEYFVSGSDSLNAAEFVRYLERKGWFRSLAADDQWEIKTDLSKLKTTDDSLKYITGYDIYQMDYGRRNPYPDGVHDFTILEITFADKYHIPYASDKTVQFYIKATSNWPPYYDVENDERIGNPQIFPIWKYRALDSYGIINELKDYIMWKAIRVDKKVFVVSSKTRDARERITSLFRLFLEYAEGVRLF